MHLYACERKRHRAQRAEQLKDRAMAAAATQSENAVKQLNTLLRELERED